MNYLATSCGDQNLPREIQVSIPPLSCYRARMFTIFYSSSFFLYKKKRLFNCLQDQGICFYTTHASLLILVKSMNSHIENVQKFVCSFFLNLYHSLSLSHLCNIMCNENRETLNSYQRFSRLQNFYDFFIYTHTHKHDIHFSLSLSLCI